MSGTKADPIGITNPPIDDLLTVPTPSTPSSSTRPSAPGRSTPTTPSCRRACSSTSARSSTSEVHEKPMSIALREINEGLLTSTPTEGADRRRHARRPRGRRAASRPTRPARCCACSPRAATTSPSCPRASALHFVGERHLVGAVRQAGAHRRVVRVTRSRTCGSASRPTSSSSRPATADLLAKAATGQADDLLTNVLLTARCPVRHGTGHAHRDVGAPGHPGQRRHAHRARRARRRRPPSGRLTGARHRPGAPSRARGRCMPCASASWPARPARPRTRRPTPHPPTAACPATWPDDGSSSPPVAPASRSTRCATSATARRASRATPWPARRPSAAPR